MGSGADTAVGEWVSDTTQLPSAQACAACNHTGSNRSNKQHRLHLGLTTHSPSNALSVFWLLFILGGSRGRRTGVAAAAHMPGGDAGDASAHVVIEISHESSLSTSAHKLCAPVLRHRHCLPAILASTRKPSLVPLRLTWLRSPSAWPGVPPCCSAGGQGEGMSDGAMRIEEHASGDEKQITVVEKQRCW